MEVVSSLLMGCGLLVDLRTLNHPCCQDPVSGNGSLVFLTLCSMCSSPYPIPALFQVPCISSSVRKSWTETRHCGRQPRHVQSLDGGHVRSSFRRLNDGVDSAFFCVIPCRLVFCRLTKTCWSSAGGALMLSQTLKHVDLNVNYLQNHGSLVLTLPLMFPTCKLQELV